MTVTDLVANFGDVIELKKPGFDLDAMKKALIGNPYWVRYNPRKEINRYGLSVTSLDGGISGIPDLDSLREYNALNGTDFKEGSFRVRTPIAQLTGLNPWLNMWEPFLGRSHFLKLDTGGFFPPHRDNGFALPPNIMRILVPIIWHKDSAVWLQEGQSLMLQEGTPYFINTSKEHCLFSFHDDTIILVLNVDATDASIQTVARNANIL